MSARVVLLGPPGAGKGTQAVELSEHLGVPAISTGDIFRTNVSGGTPLGRQAQEFMDAGLLVPDELTNAMVADRLAQADAAGGFVLDGYPRNAAQVAELDQVLTGLAQRLDLAVELTADTDEVVTRLLRRAQIEGRTDDTEPVVRRRLEVYAQQTAPVADLYDARGLLVRVGGLGGVADVTTRLHAAVDRQRADR